MPRVKQATLPPKVETICLGLSDPTRLKLLERIGKEEVCVCDLQAFVRRDQPTVSRHLAMLRKCGLVEARKEGRWSHYRRKQLPPTLAHLVDLAAPAARRLARSCC
jgi:ArsR family transcriptional regulator